MKIDLTEKQFRRLLDLVYVGNWVMNSTRGDDRIREYDDVESTVFAHCLSHGMVPLVESYQGELIPSRAFAEGGIHEAILAYEDTMFFEILAQELALRDMDSDAPTPENYDELRERIVMMDNMLQRVEDITIIDSVTVPRSRLAEAFPLPANAGRLGSRQMLPPNIRTNDNTIVYTANDGREVFWNAPDSTGRSTLYHAGILDDGTLESPTKVFPSAQYATACPFMLTDGSTLYFAAQDPETSIGGYDIYMTRRDDSTGDFLEPVNIGMPYNSPYNDILMAIDTDNGIGWWATDRNSLDSDSITVYTYLTNATRRNLNPERNDLADRAFVTDIAVTQDTDTDAAAIREQINARATAQTFDTKDTRTTDTLPYPFSIEGRAVYYRLSDFRSAEARELMSQYLQQFNLDQAYRRQLERLRIRYANGDHTVAAEIRALENSVARAVPSLRRLRNAVIRAELH